LVVNSDFRARNILYVLFDVGRTSVPESRSYAMVYAMDSRDPSSWYLRMKMLVSDMVCSWDSRWRAQSDTGSSCRRDNISELMRLRRWRDAPFV